MEQEEGERAGSGEGVEPCDQRCAEDTAGEDDHKKESGVAHVFLRIVTHLSGSRDVERSTLQCRDDSLAHSVPVFDV